ncbi:flagellar assembly protein FliT [Priestia megaterium]|nr:flagellar assembly protein FliT [Priestia megaterium]
MLQHTYELTAALHQLVQQPVDEHNREQFIHTLESLLAKRQEAMQQLQKPSSLEEKEVGKKIVQMNVLIDRELLHIRQQIARDIQTLKIKKQQVNRYVNPYEGETFDGTFYDKRN